MDVRKKNVCRQTYSFLEVKLRCLRRKTYDDKHDIRDENQHVVLANSSDQTAGLGVNASIKQHVVSLYREMNIEKLKPT